MKEIEKRKARQRKKVAVISFIIFNTVIVIALVICTIIALKLNKTKEKEVITEFMEKPYIVIDDVIISGCNYHNCGTATTIENNEEYIKVQLNTSAYCSCKECCGKTDGITKSGQKAQQWHTVAAGNKYPIGTKIFIPELQNQQNGGWFIIEDRGGSIKDGDLDIFFNDHNDAIEFGRKNLEVYIIE